MTEHWENIILYIYIMTEYWDDITSYIYIYIKWRNIGRGSMERLCCWRWWRATVTALGHINNVVYWENQEKKIGRRVLRDYLNWKLGLFQTKDIQTPLSPPLSFVPIFMIDAHSTESNEKSIFRVLPDCICSLLVRHWGFQVWHQQKKTFKSGQIYRKDLQWVETNEKSIDQFWIQNQTYLKN